jgi:hypothetical protein
MVGARHGQAPATASAVCSSATRTRTLETGPAGNRGERPMIKKVSGGYKVLSEKGKNLGGPYKTKKEAEKRLRQVEFFKHKK